MKRTLSLLFLLCIVVAMSRPGFCAEQGEETRLIKVLQSPTASLADKSDACARLKHIGTSHSIRALSVLLTNNDLSMSARYALESMPDNAAGRALLKALPKTSGLLQAG